MTDMRDDLKRCTLCADRFAGTATRHWPNPVVWFAPGAKILIGGAPVTQAYADEIGADGYSDDANTAVKATKIALGIAA